MAFAHLHLHTEYSLLDGACRIEPLMERVKALGQSSVAVTDHGAMYGVVDFYRAAQKHGIKPVIGCEVYVAARSRFDKNHALDSERYHLVLLCENNTGYQNLIKLVSHGWTEGFYTKPRIDHELLEQYHEGLIALSACLAGEIPRALQRGDYEEAKKTALWYRDLFGAENYFLEIQNHSLRDQLAILPELVRLSRETGIPLVATNDAHYLAREDAKVQQVLICIQTNHIVGENTGMEFDTEEFYVKSEQEMLALFPETPEAIENTAKIAERCNVGFEFGNTKLPHFAVPDGQDHFEYFKNLCENGLAQRCGGTPPPEYQERLDFELNVIHSMGYVDYFLIVHDFIDYARSQGIPVGPGRGSGAGSLAAYAIGITGLDPIEYSLLFERFLNPERVSMPDFDIDFCYERRQEVIDYVIRKYGADHVAQIVTFGTMAARAAIRDVGRAMGLAYSTVDAVAKQIPFELGITIDKALLRSSEFRTLYDAGGETRELIEMAQKVEGMPRHASTHAAGVVITRDPVDSYVPLARNDEAIVTQFTMVTLEELGLLKMDFLGLRTLTVIDKTQEMLRKTQPDFDIDKVDLNDDKTMDMLYAGHTQGVFQFESAGMRNLLTGRRPSGLEDLVAVVALYRPGPMEFIPDYVRNRQNPEKIRYKTPELAPILDVTYGCMIYQEQVMQVFRELAGYSYGRADIVRRAMSKKKHDVMEKERSAFIEGTAQRGIARNIANAIFDDMTSFASYAFNKSHSAAYAYVAYQTAYLKCRYPCEFMAAMLTSILDNSAKVAEYIAECSRLGIAVLPPHVNSGSTGFTVEGAKIRFGLLAIKNLGRGFIRAILAERESGGAFTSFYNFVKRLHGKESNRRGFESLILCGALDELGANRRQMLELLPLALEQLESERRRNVEGQIGFFDLSEELAGSDEIPIPPIEEMALEERMRLEKETTGLYLSGHPMADYTQLSEALHSAKISEMTGEAPQYQDNARVSLLGIITGVKKKITKSNATMAFVTLEDIAGAIEVIVFPKTLQTCGGLLREGSVVLLHGRLSLREDEETKIVCEVLEPCPDGATPRPAVKPAPPQAAPAQPEVYEGSEAQPTANDYDDLPPPPEPYEEAAPPEPPPEKPSGEKKKKPGLFLRYADENTPQEAKVRQFLEIFGVQSGRMLPVYSYYAVQEKYIRAPQGVAVNEPLLRELRRVLGAENVCIQCGGSSPL